MHIYIYIYIYILYILQRSLVRQPTDFTLRLPIEWKETMAKGDQQWTGKSIFKSKNQVGDNAPQTLWWHPPSVGESSVKPQPETYVLRRFFLWMPRRAWAVDFKCPECGPGRSLQ